MEWDIFKRKFLHLKNLNINSLLPKIDELRLMGWFSNVAAIGISESKLDKSIINSEILIGNFDLLCCNPNRNRCGVACYTRNNLSYIRKNLFPNGFENVFFEIHLPKTKLITLGIFYQLLNQTNFSKTLNEHFTKLIQLKKKLTFSVIST